MPAPNKRPIAAGAGAVALILGGVYAVEGGYVRERADPGGATRYGVTEQVARRAGYSGDMRDFPQHCDGSATACADDIYVQQYIVAPGYMPLVTIEPAIADKLVNDAVNLGEARPNKWYRETVGLPISGRPLGARDYEAYQKHPACEADLRSLASKQEAEYRMLVAHNASLGVFLGGWVSRARNLHPSGISCRSPE